MEAIRRSACGARSVAGHRSGQLFGLVEPNGSEKATIICIPLNIIPVNPDRVELFGDPVNQATPAKIGTTQSRSQPAWAF